MAKIKQFSNYLPSTIETMTTTKLNEKAIAVTELPEGAYNISPSNPKLTNKNYLMFDLHHYGRFVSESKRGKQTIDLPPGSWRILTFAQSMTEEQWREVVEEVKVEYCEIPLNKGLTALIDKEDFDKCSFRKWNADIRKNNAYARASFKGKRLMMHRFLMGITDPKILIDHINHNGLDNRKSNLRVCNTIENGMNRRSNIGSTSKFKGVSFKSKRKKWSCEICINGVSKFLGYFKDEVDAAIAYDDYAIQYTYEYRLLNFPFTQSGHSLLKSKDIDPLTNPLILINDENQTRIQ